MGGPAALFRRSFGTEPQVGWRAPGRVNLIGEHTDYNDGYVLPIAIPFGIGVAMARNGSDRLRLVSAQHGEGVAGIALDALEPGAAPGWTAYPAGVVWQLRRSGLAVGRRGGGLDIAVDGDLPGGAGLSSSAALECAVVMALDDLLRLGLTRPQAAAHARAAENDFVGVPCGVMDQYASLLCTRGHALFLDTRTLDTEQIPLDFAAAGLHLQLIDTHAPHRLVEGSYAERRRSCAEAAAALGVPALRDLDPAALDGALARLTDATARGRVRHVVTENARVAETVRLLRHGRPERIGPLLTASHASLRADYEVTGPELDLAVETALAAGASGARMTGGGFGGSVIVLSTAARAGAIAGAVFDAFAEHGFSAPARLEAQPSRGAARTAVTAGA
ncbi:galactokinase [Pseudonocardia asaccharolytica]|uniref:Galactokinase n=1 Tax=Pseudonocardia asaccharolytica DSM 44247 = NBRC 16224 TaxID=1123024 RepID=A0A511D589_9PSEU|nr:galactokinase [Pseudonocardia asaccharolytica]GEL19941.1 galactokinase [Pseudonocardia asaccharolytica DSM 44247 = NBRC 16224]